MRYLISYDFVSNTMGPGSGTRTNFRPTKSGQPCTLTPAHVAGLLEEVARSLPGGGQVTITFIWKYE
jgi:hypothetical protein